MTATCWPCEVCILEIIGPVIVGNPYCPIGAWNGRDFWMADAEKGGPWRVVGENLFGAVALRGLCCIGDDSDEYDAAKLFCCGGGAE